MPNKVNKRTVHLSTSFTIPTGNRTRRKITLAATCLLSLFVFCAVTAAIGSSNNFVHASSVNGLGVGIYWDQSCTNKTFSISWGQLDAGSNNTLTIYIRNEMSMQASLSVKTTNYTPSAALDLIALNWNYSGQVISAGQVIPLELTLTVLPNINGITNFSFNTIITASER